MSGKGLGWGFYIISGIAIGTLLSIDLKLSEIIELLKALKP